MQGTDYIFPLYLYEENMGKVERRANLDREIVAKIAAAVGGETASVQQQEEEVCALEIFDYIYGVLHSPAYRAKFKEFLKSDFPRIPYPKDAEVFALYRDAGRELRMAHLMLDPPPTLSEPTARFPVPGDNVVENVASVKVLPISNSNSQLETGKIGNTSICRVYINPTQYFDNVPLAAYEQAIGGYYPAEKWLKDRKGRALTQDDLRHYQRIILALVKTCEIMKTLH